jgi:lipopolysaccharide export system protein LptC
MRHRLPVILALLALAGLSTLAVWKLQPKPKPHVPSQARSDYTLENFQLVTLNKEGQEAFTVDAPRLERDPEGKSLTLTLPKFSFPDKGGDGRWLATSDRAWVGPKADEVRLIAQVDLLGPATDKGERTHFQTESLQVFPHKNQAQSDDAVTVTRADSILHATGLRADMKSHQIRLLADVKGRYVPRHPPL